MKRNSEVSETKFAVNVDIVKYSAMMDENRKYANKLTSKFKKRAAKAIQQSGGYVQDMVGDNILAIFSSVKDAVMVGFKVIEVLPPDRNITPSVKRMRVRVGVAGGDVGWSVKGNKKTYHGKAINLSERVQSLADSNSVYVTDAVRHLIANDSNIAFVHSGNHQFDGSEHTYAIYEAYEVRGGSIVQGDEAARRPHILTGAAQIPFTPADHEITRQVIQSIWSLPPNQIPLTRECFIDKSDLIVRKERRRHYKCYRYATIPGRIVKTFTVINEPDDLWPYAIFQNFYEFNGVMKRTYGVVMHMRQHVYLIGSVSDGNAFKVVAFPRPAALHKTIFGLIMTINDVGELLTSRVVLVDTNARNHKEAGIGVYDDDDPEILKEISIYKDGLRNSINFTLNSPVYRKKKLITQDDMVARVRNDLQWKGDKCLYNFGSGQTFNPADTKHYTYNAALTRYITSESRRADPIGEA